MFERKFSTAGNRVRPIIRTVERRKITTTIVCCARVLLGVHIILLLFPDGEITASEISPHTIIIHVHYGTEVSTRILNVNIVPEIRVKNNERCTGFVCLHTAEIFAAGCRVPRSTGR